MFGRDAYCYPNILQYCKYHCYYLFSYAFDTNVVSINLKTMEPVFNLLKRMSHQCRSRLHYINSHNIKQHTFKSCCYSLFQYFFHFPFLILLIKNYPCLFPPPHLMINDRVIRLNQSMRNLVCRRSMIGKTCLRLVGILGLPVTMTGNFCQILLYIQ